MNVATRVYATSYVHTDRVHTDISLSATSMGKNVLFHHEINPRRSNNGRSKKTDGDREFDTISPATTSAYLYYDYDTRVVQTL